MLQQERLGEQRRDEVAGDELAGAVDEEAAVGVAVPGDADVGLLGDRPRSTMSRRFSSMSGLASWFGKRPSISKHSRVVRQGSRSNSFGATSPPMPLPASSTTLNGLMTAGSMNDITCSTYGVEHVLRASTRAAARRPAAAGVPSAIMSRMSAMPASPLSGNASLPHHLHAVVLLRIVRRGDLRRRRRGRRARPRSTACRSAIIP